ncbi:nucleoside deaminase [Roseospira navarrensis]|uniref:nucleoside deaminase n=1 Tax=Roseospira navarrensis TaxID=140058 RepID=UPI001B85D2F8
MTDPHAKPPASDKPYPGPPPLRPEGARAGPYAGIESEDDPWIRLACAEAVASVRAGGGPFGAVVVQVDDASGTVIRHWVERNRVTESFDPTAHAEVCAVRAVARDLGVFHLDRIEAGTARLPQPGPTSHCVLYASTEPCPMCYGAIAWARIPVLVFAATRFDAAADGVDFQDADLHAAVARPYRERAGMVIRRADTPGSLEAFRLWAEGDAVRY